MLWSIALVTALRNLDDPGYAGFGSISTSARRFGLRSDVRFGPKSDLIVARMRDDAMGQQRSFDHLIGADEDRLRHGEPQRLRCFEVDGQFIFGRPLHW
jgi:hypothetical protein